MPARPKELEVRFSRLEAARDLRLSVATFKKLISQGLLPQADFPNPDRALQGFSPEYIVRARRILDERPEIIKEARYEARHFDEVQVVPPTDETGTRPE
jgi:hypothetical protein